MAITTRAILKTYFETNDFPTAAEFAQFIDSVVNIVDDGALVGGETGITAHAGGGQANAYQLIKKNNLITTVAAPSDSVKLPVAIAGMTCTVGNRGANSCDVYPSSGEQIEKLIVDGALGVNNNIIVSFFCVNAGLWVASATAIA